MKNQTKAPLSKKPDLKLVTVRLPREMYGEVVELARDQRRSIHGQIVWAVEQHIEQEKQAA